MQGFMKFVFTQGGKEILEKFQGTKSQQKNPPPIKPKMSKIPSEQGWFHSPTVCPDRFECPCVNTIKIPFRAQASIPPHFKLCQPSPNPTPKNHLWRTISNLFNWPHFETRKQSKKIYIFHSFIHSLLLNSVISHSVALKLDYTFSHSFCKTFPGSIIWKVIHLQHVFDSC